MGIIKRVAGVILVFSLITGMLVGFSGRPARADASFKMVGARSRGMGGAGVISSENENGALWNPATLSQEDAIDFGVQAGAELQSTRDFLGEAQDLEDFEEEVSNLDSIVNSRFNDTTAYNNFFRLIKELRDVNKDGQGLLGEFTGGVNLRWSGWSIGANNYTTFSGGTSFGLDNIVFSGMTGDGGDSIAREFVTGDSTTVDLSDASSKDIGSYDTSTVESVNKELSDALGGDTVGATFGFNDDATSDSVSRYIVHRIAQEDPTGDTVTDEVIKEASKTLMPTIVSVAGGDTDTFDTEAQNLVLEGSSIHEIGLNYAHPRPIARPLSAPLYVGTSLKYMQAELAYMEYNIFDDRDIGDQAEDVLDNQTEESSSFGLDLGLAWDARDQMGLKFGLVGKNLNSPSFDKPDTAPEAELELDPQFRLGVSGYPLDLFGGSLGRDWWKLAVDYDITENETLMGDYKKQYLAIGNEFNILNRGWGNLALRAGLRENLAESTEGRIYTAGVGLNMLYLNVDLSGSISDKETEDEDGEEIPTQVGAAANVSFRF